MYVKQVSTEGGRNDMKLINLFEKCVNADYVHVENDGDYAVKRDDNTLYILFEYSNSRRDWINSFTFGAKPYKDMEIKWRCHRGFLKVWKSVEVYIAPYIMDKSVEKIYVVGYSHGAAIATLCHEYVWFHRPDLREGGLEGVGFGCPRCYFGWRIKKSLRERWKHFHPIRNMRDIVTHLPPVLLGFTHVNRVIQLPKNGYMGKYSKLSCVNAHYIPNYIYNLREFDVEVEEI